MSTPWTVPPLWQGETCAILASGTSMNQGVADAVRDAGVHAIAVNTTYRLAAFADVVYASDELWWKTHHADVRAAMPDASCVSVQQTPFADVLLLRNTGPDGFDPHPACLRTGKNSGYAAIHLAAHLGCTRIILCGFDMHGGHWHGRHPEPLRNAGEGIFAAWLTCFETLVPELDRLGITVINCTPASALKAFPRMKLTSALRVAMVD